MATAPLVAAWQRGMANLPGPATGGSRRGAFPGTALDLRVELQLAGVWTDVTSLTYQRDAISIKRGRSDEANIAEPSTLGLTLNNRDGRFSPRNPTGPYYGTIGRNTPIRVSLGGPLPSVRFTGEVSAWPVRWDTSGSDVWVPIEAAGVLRRVGQSTAPFRSSLYRRMSRAAGVLGYWPAEDGDGSGSIASGAGGEAITVTGAPDYAGSDVFASSDPIPLLQGSQWQGRVPTYTSTGEFQVRLLLATPAAGSVATMVLQITTNGTCTYLRLFYDTPTSGTLTVQFFDSGGISLGALAALTGMNGNLRVHVQAENVGADVSARITVVEDDGTTSTASGTIAGTQIGRVLNLKVNQSGSAATDMAVGHLSVQSAITSTDDLADELSGWVGETATERIQRLGAEEDIPVLVVGTPADSTAMGAQTTKTLAELLRECADTDGGLLFEPRDTFGLVYRTREALYNRPATVTLDYAAHELSTLDPVDDDRYVRNDITASRVGGSSSRQILTTGALSVADPPDGVGRYTEAISINPETDAVLGDHAGWRLHLGTVDEARYPVIELNLGSPALAGSEALVSALLVLDVGDELVVVNPPAWLPPGDITQGVVGMVETLNAFEHRLELNCTPSSPWDVAVYDAGDRYSSDGSTLAAAVDATTAALQVATPAGPLWTTAAADMPFDVTVGGERMTVTAVAGATSPQTFTVTRSVNGVVKGQDAGAELALSPAAVYAL